MTQALAIDHLVFAAADLAQADAFARGALGAATVAGGRHDFMGTHNRLLRLQGAAGEGAYLEFIAIDPDAPAPGHPRWFGLDAPALQQALRESPRLLHWVARGERIDERRAALAALDLDPGETREAARGALRWRISVRPQGDLLLGGALPTLIEWGSAHPTATLPPGGVALERLRLRGVPASAAEALGLHEVAGLALDAQAPPPALELALLTPRGRLVFNAFPQP